LLDACRKKKKRKKKKKGWLNDDDNAAVVKEMELVQELQEEGGSLGRFSQTYIPTEALLGDDDAGGFSLFGFAIDPIVSPQKETTATEQESKEEEPPEQSQSENDELAHMQKATNEPRDRHSRSDRNHQQGRIQQEGAAASTIAPMPKKRMGIEIGRHGVLFIPRVMARAPCLVMLCVLMLVGVLGTLIFFPTYHPISLDVNVDDYQVDGDPSRPRYDNAKSSHFSRPSYVVKGWDGGKCAGSTEFYNSFASSPETQERLDCCAQFQHELATPGGEDSVSRADAVRECENRLMCRTLGCCFNDANQKCTTPPWQFFTGAERGGIRPGSDSRGLTAAAAAAAESSVAGHVGSVETLAQEHELQEQPQRKLASPDKNKLMSRTFEVVTEQEYVTLRLWYLHREGMGGDMLGEDELYAVRRLEDALTAGWIGREEQAVKHQAQDEQATPPVEGALHIFPDFPAYLNEGPFGLEKEGGPTHHTSNEQRAFDGAFHATLVSPADGIGGTAINKASLSAAAAKGYAFVGFEFEHDVKTVTGSRGWGAFGLTKAADAVTEQWPTVFVTLDGADGYRWSMRKAGVTIYQPLLTHLPDEAYLQKQRLLVGTAFPHRIFFASHLDDIDRQSPPSIAYADEAMSEMSSATVDGLFGDDSVVLDGNIMENGYLLKNLRYVELQDLGVTSSEIISDDADSSERMVPDGLDVNGIDVSKLPKQQTIHNTCLSEWTVWKTKVPGMGEANGSPWAWDKYVHDTHMARSRCAPIDSALSYLFPEEKSAGERGFGADSYSWSMGTIRCKDTQNRWISRTLDKCGVDIDSSLMKPYKMWQPSYPACVGSNVSTMPILEFNGRGEKLSPYKEHIVQWLGAYRKSEYFDRNFLHASPTALPYPSSSLLSSTLRVPIDLLDDYRAFLEGYQSPLFTVIFQGGNILEDQLTDALKSDMLQVIGSLSFVLGYMIVSLHSVFLGFMGLLTCILPFPIVLFFHRVVCGYDKLNMLTFTSLWIIAGIGADNVFVFTEAWLHSRVLVVEGHPAPIAHRLTWVMREAGCAMFITSFTTAMAFFGNATSGIFAIRTFGLFLGGLVLTNYVLVMSWYAAALAYHQSVLDHLRKSSSAERQREEKEQANGDNTDSGGSNGAGRRPYHWEAGGAAITLGDGQSVGQEVVGTDVGENVGAVDTPVAAVKTVHFCGIPITTDSPHMLHAIGAAQSLYTTTSNGAFSTCSLLCGRRNATRVSDGLVRFRGLCLRYNPIVLLLRLMRRLPSKRFTVRFYHKALYKLRWPLFAIALCMLTATLSVANGLRPSTLRQTILPPTSNFEMVRSLGQDWLHGQGEKRGTLFLSGVETAQPFYSAIALPDLLTNKNYALPPDGWRERWLENEKRKAAEIAADRRASGFGEGEMSPVERMCVTMAGTLLLFGSLLSSAYSYACIQQRPLGPVAVPRWATKPHHRNRAWATLILPIVQLVGGILLIIHSMRVATTQPGGGEGCGSGSDCAVGSHGHIVLGMIGTLLVLLSVACLIVSWVCYSQRSFWPFTVPEQANNQPYYTQHFYAFYHPQPHPPLMDAGGIGPRDPEKPEVNTPFWWGDGGIRDSTNATASQGQGAAMGQRKMNQIPAPPGVRWGDRTFWFAFGLLVLGLLLLTIGVNGVVRGDKGAGDAVMVLTGVVFWMFAAMAAMMAYICSSPVPEPTERHHALPMPVDEPGENGGEGRNEEQTLFLPGAIGDLYRSNRCDKANRGRKMGVNLRWCWWSPYGPGIGPIRIPSWVDDAWVAGEKASEQEKARTKERAQEKAERERDAEEEPGEDKEQERRKLKRTPSLGPNRTSNLAMAKMKSIRSLRARVRARAKAKAEARARPAYLRGYRWFSWLALVFAIVGLIFVLEGASRLISVGRGGGSGMDEGTDKEAYEAVGSRGDWEGGDDSYKKSMSREMTQLLLFLFGSAFTLVGMVLTAQSRALGRGKRVDDYLISSLAALPTSLTHALRTRSMTMGSVLSLRSGPSVGTGATIGGGGAFRPKRKQKKAAGNDGHDRGEVKAEEKDAPTSTLPHPLAPQENSEDQCKDAKTPQRDKARRRLEEQMSPEFMPDSKDVLKEAEDNTPSPKRVRDEKQDENQEEEENKEKEKRIWQPIFRRGGDGPDRSAKNKTAVMERPTIPEVTDELLLWLQDHKLSELADHLAKLGAETVADLLRFESEAKRLRPWSALDPPFDSDGVSYSLQGNPCWLDTELTGRKRVEAKLDKEDSDMNEEESSLMDYMMKGESGSDKEEDDERRAINEQEAKRAAARRRAQLSSIVRKGGDGPGREAVPSRGKGIPPPLKPLAPLPSLRSHRSKKRDEEEDNDETVSHVREFVLEGDRVRGEAAARQAVLARTNATHDKQGRVKQRLKERLAAALYAERAIADEKEIAQYAELRRKQRHFNAAAGICFSIGALLFVIGCSLIQGSSDDGGKGGGGGGGTNDEGTPTRTRNRSGPGLDGADAITLLCAGLLLTCWSFILAPWAWASYVQEPLLVHSKGLLSFLGYCCCCLFGCGGWRCRRRSGSSAYCLAMERKGSGDENFKHDSDKLKTSQKVAPFNGDDDGDADTPRTSDGNEPNSENGENAWGDVVLKVLPLPWLRNNRPLACLAVVMLLLLLQLGLCLTVLGAFATHSHRTGNEGSGSDLVDQLAKNLMVWWGVMFVLLAVGMGGTSAATLKERRILGIFNQMNLEADTLPELMRKNTEHPRSYGSEGFGRDGRPRMGLLTWQQRRLRKFNGVCLLGGAAVAFFVTGVVLLAVRASWADDSGSGRGRGERSSEESSGYWEQYSYYEDDDRARDAISAEEGLKSLMLMLGIVCEMLAGLAILTTWNRWVEWVLMGHLEAVNPNKPTPAGELPPSNARSNARDSSPSSGSPSAGRGLPSGDRVTGELSHEDFLESFVQQRRQEQQRRRGMLEAGLDEEEPLQEDSPEQRAEHEERQRQEDWERQWGERQQMGWCGMGALAMQERKKIRGNKDHPKMPRAIYSGVVIGLILFVLGLLLILDGTDVVSIFRTGNSTDDDGSKGTSRDENNDRRNGGGGDSSRPYTAIESNQSTCLDASGRLLAGLTGALLLVISMAICSVAYRARKLNHGGSEATFLPKNAIGMLITAYVYPHQERQLGLEDDDDDDGAAPDEGDDCRQQGEQEQGKEHTHEEGKEEEAESSCRGRRKSPVSALPLAASGLSPGAPGSRAAAMKEIQDEEQAAARAVATAVKVRAAGLLRRRRAAMLAVRKAASDDDACHLMGLMFAVAILALVLIFFAVPGSGVCEDDFSILYSSVSVMPTKAYPRSLFNDGQSGGSNSDDDLGSGGSGGNINGTINVSTVLKVVSVLCFGTMVAACLSAWGIWTGNFFFGSKGMTKLYLKQIMERRRLVAAKVQRHAKIKQEEEEEEAKEEEQEEEAEKTLLQDIDSDDDEVDRRKGVEVDFVKEAAASRIQALVRARQQREVYRAPYDAALRRQSTSTGSGSCPKVGSGSISSRMRRQVRDERYHQQQSKQQQRAWRLWRGLCCCFVGAIFGTLGVCMLTLAASERYSASGEPIRINSMATDEMSDRPLDDQFANHFIAVTDQSLKSAEARAAAERGGYSLDFETLRDRRLDGLRFIHLGGGLLLLISGIVSVVLVLLRREFKLTISLRKADKDKGLPPSKEDVNDAPTAPAAAQLRGMHNIRDRGSELDRHRHTYEDDQRGHRSNEDDSGNREADGRLDGARSPRPRGLISIPRLQHRSSRNATIRVNGERVRRLSHSHFRALSHNSKNSTAVDGSVGSGCALEGAVQSEILRPGGRLCYTFVRAWGLRAATNDVTDMEAGFVVDQSDKTGGSEGDGGDGSSSSNGSGSSNNGDSSSSSSSSSSNGGSGSGGSGLPLLTMLLLVGGIITTITALYSPQYAMNEYAHAFTTASSWSSGETHSYSSNGRYMPTYTDDELLSPLRYTYDENGNARRTGFSIEDAMEVDPTLLKLRKWVASSSAAEAGVADAGAAPTRKPHARENTFLEKQDKGVGLSVSKAFKVPILGENKYANVIIAHGVRGSAVEFPGDLSRNDDGDNRAGGQKGDSAEEAAKARLHYPSLLLPPNRFDPTSPQAQVAAYRNCIALEEVSGWLITTPAPLCAMKDFARYLHTCRRRKMPKMPHVASNTSLPTLTPAEHEVMALGHFPLPSELFEREFYLFLYNGYKICAQGGVGLATLLNMTFPGEDTTSEGGHSTWTHWGWSDDEKWDRLSSTDRWEADEGAPDGTTIASTVEGVPGLWWRMRLAFMASKLRATFDKTLPGYELHTTHYSKWTQLMELLNNGSPTHMQGYQAGDQWARMFVELEFVQGTLLACALAVVCAVIALVIFVKDSTIVVLAGVTIIGILSSVIASLVLMGKGLGVVEALSLAITVGLSVDYVIHLGHAYNHSILQTTYKRTRSALDTRAASIFSAAVTTIGSAAFLFGCQVQIFPAFGTIFVLLLAFSLIWSLCFFSVLLMLFGPSKRRRLQDVLTDRANFVKILSEKLFSPSKKAAPPGLQIRGQRINGW
jgi:hypothetical protein